MLFNKASLFAVTMATFSAATGQLVINEIMRNPANVETERAGEWFELFNPTDSVVDIDGWTIKDDGTNSEVINNGGALTIAPGAYLVLGNNGDFATNGGVNVDYVYDNARTFLNNADDELVLLDGSSVEVDRVNWDGGATFPNQDGAAMALLDPALDNNDSKNWCNATTVYGSGDTGTPGAANDCPLPTVVINEIMRNPSTVSDRAGEWFELFNPTATAIDINGWAIKDDGTNSFVIDNGGALIVAPGGYLVLGNNANNATNGGVTLDFEYDGGLIFLNNAGDELVLLAGSLEIDRVNFDGSGGAFPSQAGAAMALRNPTDDNNVSSNWCDASTPYGDGDKGTPGAANDCDVVRRLAHGGVRGSA